MPRRSFDKSEHFLFQPSTVCVFSGQPLMFPVSGSNRCGSPALAGTEHIRAPNPGHYKKISISFAVNFNFILLPISISSCCQFQFHLLPISISSAANFNFICCQFQFHPT
jgi:hypothetical protein